MKPRSLVALVVLLLAAAPAFAARGLEEPPGLGKVVKGARGTDVSAALASPGVGAGCKEALALTDLAGLACRSAVASALVRARPLDKGADLTARTTLLRDLAKAADAVTAFAPLTPPPGFARARFDALAAVGRALMAGSDELSVLPATHALAAQVAAALAETPAPRRVACGAVQRALDAAGAAGVGIEESGALLGLLTSHRCLVDEERLASKPKPVALAGSDDAKKVAASASAQGAIADYASSRALELERCAKHVDAAERPVDGDKLRACLCGAMARWRFPQHAAGASGEIAFRRASVAVKLDAAGALADCGPVRATP
ncbi:MAG: hypothetical protein HYS27_18795 [Deltaproteobacteria bacterium]|nr:hypothetical protein [Deltaproteobacteria bacterium]